MLKTILKIVLLGAIVIAMTWGVSWIIQQGGEVPLEIRGREYRPSMLAILLAGLVGLFVFWLFIKLVEFGLACVAFIMGDKNAISRFFGRRRAKRGMQALETSVLALAAGEGKIALQKAYRADKDLDSPAMTNLLIAQAARAQGKPKEAEAAYKKMLETNKAGRFIGIRGLMQDRQEAGDNETAAKLAQKALELQPKDASTVNALFDLQIETQDWQGARDTLAAKAKLEKMPAEVAKRREAVLAISEAKSLDPEAEGERYESLVAKAYRTAPNLVPAAVLAAKAQALAGNARQADSIIVKAWNANPHPDLAQAYADLAPNETAEQRLRRFKVLTKRQKKNDETRMLSAELLVASEDFPGARRAMGPLADEPKTSRQMAIMAAIENGEGADDTIVRAYLARAMQASRGEQWVCDSCHEVHAEWGAVCSNCGHFDTMDWVLPPENNDADSGMGVLMPLLMNSGSSENAEEGEVIDA